MNRKMSDERLLRLADKLQGVGAYAEVGPVPNKKFDLSYFIDGDEKPADCGFVACACGWAYFDPWFMRRKIHECFANMADKPEWNDWRAADFFGIHEYEAARLFHPNPPTYVADNPYPVTVAKAIRKFVKDRP